jgi:hypothetical protein
MSSHAFLFLDVFTAMPDDALNEALLPQGLIGWLKR